jgi:hypothetical protein
MTRTRAPRAIGLSGCDEIIARKAADLLEDAAASGTLAFESDIATAIRERRLDDAMTLQRAAFRARMLGGINRARSGFDQEQRVLLDMPAERRARRRSVTLLTIGKIAVAGAEHPCVVRDLSEAGAGIACDVALTPGAAVRLAMRGLPPTPARVRWYDGKFGGVQFDSVQDAQVILSVSLRRDADVPRAARLPLETPVVMTARGRGFAMSAADISPGGMKLRGACDVAIGTRVDLRLGAVRDVLGGTICWVQGELIGIRFAQMLTHAQMAALIVDDHK